MIKQLSLEQHVGEMQKLAVVLQQYTYPHVTKSDEYVITCLKLRTIHVLGYEVEVYYSQEDHEDRKFKIFQVNSDNFVPFYIILNVLAVKFLGQEGLMHALIELAGKKMYNFFIIEMKKNKERILIEGGESKRHVEIDYQYYKKME